MASADGTTTRDEILAARRAKYTEERAQRRRDWLNRRNLNRG